MGLNLYYLLLVFALYNSHIVECFHIINSYYKTYIISIIKGVKPGPCLVPPSPAGASQPSSDYFSHCMLVRQLVRHALTILPLTLCH